MRKLSFLVLGLLIVSMFLVAPPASAAPGATIEIWTAENGASTSFDLYPASSINITVTIMNQQTQSAIFTVEAINSVTDGVSRKAVLTPDIETTPLTTPDLTHVSSPSSSHSFDLTLTIPQSMTANTYGLTLFVRTTSPSHENNNITLQINVPSATNIGVFSAEPARSYVDPGRSATTSVRLRNYGNQAPVGGFAGITIGSLPAGWDFDLPDDDLVAILPDTTSAELNVTITAANTSSDGDVVLNIYPTDQNGVAIPDTDPFPYTVTINPVPFLAVTSVEYSTTDNARLMAGMDVTIRTTVENPSGINAVDIPLIIYDDIGGDRTELTSQNISILAGANITEEFVISLSKSGVHTIIASVSPNSTGASLQEFSAGISLDVAISPLIFILIGFIGLTIGLSILVLMVVFDRIRFPAELSLSSLKTEIATSEAGPDIGDISDLDISSIEPASLFPKADEPLKSVEEKKPRTAPPKEGRKKERQKLKPKEPAFEEPDPAPVKRPKATPKPPKPKTAPAPKPAPTPKPTPAPAPVPEEEEPAEALEDDEYLRDDMKDADRSIQEAKLKEIDVASLERMMKEAKNAYASREFSKARSFTDNITRRIKELLARREEARREIRDAQALIFSLKYTDMDLSQSKSFLTKAETAYKNGDFKDAITNASKSKERAGEMEKINGNNGPSSDNDSSDSGFDDEVRL